MKEFKVNCSQEFYSDTLEIVKGIKFTPRELDIIACMLSGRAAKTIGSFLSISRKTVDTHIHNIMLKLECTSREGIRDFIEKSNKYSAVKQHYSGLLIATNFKKLLYEVLAKIGKDKPSCLIIYDQKQELPLLHDLRNDLKLAGIETSVEAKANYSQKQLIYKLDTQPNRYLLYSVYRPLIRQILSCDGEEKLEVGTLVKRAAQSSGRIIFLLKEITSDISHIIPEKSYMLLGNQTNYYLAVFEILKRILPAINFDKLVFEFKKQYQTIYGGAEIPSSSTEIEASTFLQEVPKNHILAKVLKKENRLRFSSGFVCLIVVSTVLLILNSKANTLYHKDKIKNYEIHKTPSIRSDLSIPADNIFLNRPELIDQMKEKLKGEKGIQTVALIGMGGAGKTTIARQYAHYQASPIVWEINAETEESLMNSLENLAYVLSKTEQEKKVLRGLQDIKDSQERKKKILFFVKERLRLHPFWLLIYDNIEKFIDIQKYFPTNSGAWGNGKVIVTTRDNNIQNNSHIHNSIQIKELSFTECSELFTKIMNNGSQFNPLQKEQVSKFLNNIPPFPLDVSLAAYYLKTTNISYTKYLNYLKTHNQAFAILQENVLKEASDYTKTRYSIITLSLKQLIGMNQDFGDILLFISLLDSQNIPRELLATYKNDVVVDNFIYNLKKYSLITNQSFISPDSISMLSIHRSTQEICLSYLIKNFEVKNQLKLFQSITHALENYGAETIEKEDLPKIRLLVNHCEVFLKHKDLLTETMRGLIEEKLGGAYSYLGNYIKAKNNLEKSILKLSKYGNQHYVNIARSLAYLGNIYTDRGDYEKAKVVLEQSLLIYRKHFPKNYGGIAQTLAYLGNAYRDLGNYENAKDLLEQSLTIYRKHFPENYVAIARVSTFLGIVYTVLGDYGRARNLLDQSLIIYKNHVSENHVGVAWVLAHLGNVYRKINNHEKARDLLEQSLIIYKENFPEGHIKTAWALSSLGDSYRSLGNYEKAKNLLEQSLIIYKQHLSENHLVIAGILAYLGNVYMDKGDYEKAKDLLEQSFIIYKKHFPDNHIKTAWILTLLGNVYGKMGQNKKAKDILEKSLAIYKKHFPENHPELIWALGCLENI